MFSVCEVYRDGGYGTFRWLRIVRGRVWQRHGGGTMHRMVRLDYSCILSCYGKYKFFLLGG